MKEDVRPARPAPFVREDDDASASASVIVPIVCELIGVPESVVDLGGGTGTWCHYFKKAGAAKVTCFDNPAFPRSELRIDADAFVGWNLAAGLPECVTSRLAICLEVAEHLPESRSKDVVRFLTGSASIVL